MPEQDLDKSIANRIEELHREQRRLDEHQRKTEERLQRIEGELRQLQAKDDEDLAPARSKTEDIDEMVDDLKRAPKSFSELRGKKLYGIFAISHPSPQVREWVLSEGFYYGTIIDEILALDVPEDFPPRVFGR